MARINTTTHALIVASAVTVTAFAAMVSGAHAQSQKSAPSAAPATKAATPATTAPSAPATAPSPATTTAQVRPPQQQQQAPIAVPANLNVVMTNELQRRAQACAVKGVAYVWAPNRNYGAENASTGKVSTSLGACRQRKITADEMRKGGVDEATIARVLGTDARASQ